MKYYLAYGSNLSVAQMLRRCPDAYYVGKASLENMQLQFRGSKTGSYLTVEPCEGQTVPCLVWAVSREDERNLDMYEGFPKFYQKKNIKLPAEGFVKGFSGMIHAFYYFMTGARPIGLPTTDYWLTCSQGYKRFGFDEAILEAALYRTLLLEGEYAYGMKYRGFSPGCQPKEDFVGVTDDPLKKYHDVLIYERELTQEELDDYELAKIS